MTSWHATDSLHDEIDLLRTENAKLRQHLKDYGVSHDAIELENATLRAALEKRPVMWRVMDDNVWRVFGDEKEAADYAEKIGMNYQGLYARAALEETK